MPYLDDYKNYFDSIKSKINEIIRKEINKSDYLYKFEELENTFYYKLEIIETSKEIITQLNEELAKKGINLSRENENNYYHVKYGDITPHCIETDTFRIPTYTPGSKDFCLEIKCCGLEALSVNLYRELENLYSSIIDNMNIISGIINTLYDIKISNYSWDNIQEKLEQESNLEIEILEIMKNYAPNISVKEIKQRNINFVSFRDANWYWISKELRNIFTHHSFFEILELHPISDSLEPYHYRFSENKFPYFNELVKLSNYFDDDLTRLDNFISWTLRNCEKTLKSILKQIQKEISDSFSLPVSPIKIKKAEKIKSMEYKRTGDIKEVEKNLDKMNVFELTELFIQRTELNNDILEDSNNFIIKAIDGDFPKGTIRNIMLKYFEEERIKSEQLYDLHKELKSSKKYNKKIVFIIIKELTEKLKNQIDFFYLENSLKIVYFTIDEIKNSIKNKNEKEFLYNKVYEYKSDLYDIRSPVSGEAFFGRISNIKNLEQFIKDGKPFAIFGLRKIGKTSILKYISETPRKYPISFVDLQGMGEKDCKYVFGKILVELINDIKEKYPYIQILPETTNKDFTNISYGEIQDIFNREIQNIIKIIKEKETCELILFVFDEGDLLLPIKNIYNGFANFVEFLQYLRFINSYTKGFINFCFISKDANLCHQLKFDDIANPLFEGINDYYLPHLNEKDTIFMIESVGKRMGISYKENCLKEIFLLSGGHPFITRQLCSSIVKNIEKRPCRVISNDLLKGKNHFLKNNDYLKQIIAQINELEQYILIFISNSGNYTNTEKEILDYFENYGYKKIHINESLKNLTRYYILKREENNYIFQIKILAEWIKDNYNINEIRGIK